MDFWDGAFRLVTAAFLVSVALGGGVAAQLDTPQPVWAAATEAALERIVDDHNALVDDTSSNPVSGLASDQRVTIVVTAPDDSVAQFSFRTDATARIVEFRAGPRDDATLRMFTDPTTVDRVADAPDRAAAFEAALRAGDVRLEGVSPTNRVSVALLGLVLWALASPVQAAAVGAVAVVGAGVAAVAGAKAVGGAAAAGSAGTAGASTTGGRVGGSNGLSGTTVGSSAAGTPGDPVADTPTDPLAQTGGRTVTAGSSVDPVGLADRVLSVFERVLFVVALAKKLGGRLRRRFGSRAARFLGRFGVGRAPDEQVESPALERAGGPRARRRPAPRRRRR